MPQEKYRNLMPSVHFQSSGKMEIAFSAIHHIYPQLEVADLQKECESISSQFKAAWKKILIFAAIAVCSVIIGAASTGIGSGLIAGVIFKIEMEGGKLSGITMSGIEKIESLKASGSENDFFMFRG